MDDNKLNQYADKKAYNNLPVPEGQYLAPFLVEDWDTVKAMNLYRDNLETWHFSGIPVLVAFTPVTAEQFPGTMKFFWSSVRTHIAELHGDPNVISYDKFLDDMSEEGEGGYDPAQTESFENTSFQGLLYNVVYLIGIHALKIFFNNPPRHLITFFLDWFLSQITAYKSIC